MNCMNCPGITLSNLFQFHLYLSWHAFPISSIRVPNIQDVRKIVFFPNRLVIAARDLKNSERNTSVLSTPLILYWPATTNSGPVVLARERRQNTEKSLKKAQFYGTPCLYLQLSF